MFEGAPDDRFLPFFVILIAEATVLLQGEQGFDGGVVGALVGGFIAEIQREGVEVGDNVFEQGSL